MASFEDIKKSLDKWISLMDDPEVAAEFDGYNKVFQLSFPDIDAHIKMIFEDKTARLEDGVADNADMTLEVESDLFLGISTGEVDPMEAFMEGKLKPKGSMSDLEKLEIFMDLED